MNPETFFDKFGLLADTPNGVQKLRELILQLAVQGKLVRQDANDEPAAVLLEKIRVEKERLVKEKKIKKSKPLSLLMENDIPFKLPSSWIWIPLGEGVDYNGAQKVSPNEIPDDAWLLDLENIEKDTSRIIQRIMFKDKKSKSTKSKFEKGDVLYGKLRPYLNKVVVADGGGYCTTEIIPLRGYHDIFPKYLMYALKRPDFLEYVNSKTYGVKMPRLGTEDGRSAPFPLPPFEEQHRIVAKVDQLMALCDELESRQQKKQEARLRLNSAALDKLLTAHEPAEFAIHWQRVCDNFDLLYDNPETVGELRKAILQLAVQGKLVRQDENDEPAAVLLGEIKAEKERLVKEGKIKKSKALPPVEADKIPYPIPNMWEWCRWENISFKIGDLDHKMPQERDSGMPYISPRDFTQNNGIDFVNAKKISIEDFERLSKKIMPEIYDIIFPRYGTIGENRYVITENEFLASYSCAIIKNLNGFIEPKYSYYYSISLLVKNEIERYINKTTQPNVGLKSINRFLYPLPPLEEQRRIVAKVDHLMALCDELGSKLNQSQTDGAKLMEAVVAGLVGA